MKNKSNLSTGREATSKPLSPDRRTPSDGESQHSNEHPLTVKEEMALLQAVSKGTGRGFTQAEAERVRQWAIDIRHRVSLLELVLKGCVKVGFRDDGELSFTAVDPEEILKSREEK